MGIDDHDEPKLENCDVELNDELAGSDFTCAAFTPVISHYGCALFMLGTSDGGIIVYNPSNNEFLDGGQKKIIMHEEIGHISVKNGCVVLGGSQGRLAKYSIISGNLLPPDIPDDIVILPNPYGGITSMTMDDLNNEGIVATTKGYICYIKFQDKVIIPLVSKVD